MPKKDSRRHSAFGIQAELSCACILAKEHLEYEAMTSSRIAALPSGQPPRAFSFSGSTSASSVMRRERRTGLAIRILKSAADCQKAIAAKHHNKAAALAFSVGAAVGEFLSFRSNSLKQVEGAYKSAEVKRLRPNPVRAHLETMLPSLRLRIRAKPTTDALWREAAEKYPGLKRSTFYRWFPAKSHR